MKLSRSAILSTAFAILDEEGFERLSIRAVAKRLGVQASALSWHVGKKAELISLMAATYSTAALAAAPGGAGWAERLEVYGRTFRAAMLRHRDSARICVAARPLTDAETAARRLSAPLVEAGLQAQKALSFQAAVIAYSLGWVAYEQSQSMHDHLTNMIDFDHSFEVGLLAMVRGFAEDVERGDSDRTLDIVRKQSASSKGQ